MTTQSKMLQQDEHGSLFRGEILHNIALNQYTSWQIGGIADRVFKPVDLEDLQTLMTLLSADESILFLGLGSNVLIGDGGVRGNVILTQGKLKQLDLLTNNMIRAEAGLSCAQVARFAARNGLINIEYLAGIPGTIGGALAMNAGAFGGETWQNVCAVDVINRQGKLIRRLANEYQIGYRTVVKPENEWFIAAYFQCDSGDKQIALEKIKNLLARRRDTQPINVPTCGSVFRNPPGDYAARLIENCGLKGFGIGQARVSTKHANFIINEGQASAQDVEDLMNEIKKIVQQQYNILLEPEVIFIGEKKQGISDAIKDR